MPIALRHRDESVLPFSVVPGLSVHREIAATVMAGMQKRTVAEIQDRFSAGHRAYVASMHGVPAAWGWIATRSATIGELKVAFSFSPAERYLWNFVTLPDFRGRGIYPRLLEAIVDAERAEAERFWIAYAPENHASGAGIQKAGFAIVAELSFAGDGTPVVKEMRAGGGEAASRLLGLPDTTKPISQCWKCARGPAPAESDCASGSCCCDYQRPETACAE